MGRGLHTILQCGSACERLAGRRAPCGAPAAHGTRFASIAMYPFPFAKGVANENPTSADQHRCGSSTTHQFRSGPKQRDALARTNAEQPGSPVLIAVILIAVHAQLFAEFLADFFDSREHLLPRELFVVVAGKFLVAKFLGPHVAEWCLQFDGHRR